MQIRSIHVKNFRLLEDVHLSLEEQTTVIIGRNNSGKTSLAELFRRLFSENSPTFMLEDFSLAIHERFWEAFSLKQAGQEEIDIRTSLPVIEVELTVCYDPNASDLGLLSEFIVDLNPACTETRVVIRYQLKGGAINKFLDGIEGGESIPLEEQKRIFFRAIKERIPTSYEAALLAVDPNDPTNERNMNWAVFRALLQSEVINAQRGLDDTTNKDNDVLGKILEALFNNAKSDFADENDQATARTLDEAVKSMQGQIDKSFNDQLSSLFEAFSLFGYPGLPDPKLQTETQLDVERLLKNHTKVRYPGVNGVNLPEAYNGLGARNLIYILLRLLALYKSFKTKQPALGIHLIFIEEPEAHLHPQMQEVFISQLGKIVDYFTESYKDDQPWPVQFIVTTHSSHIANKASFEAMRYFLVKSKEGFCSTEIKDLRGGLDQIPSDNKDFLHQYMTLTCCDLFFADKAILIEGTAERLLLPRMIEKASPNLCSQYISVLEVGGAYAHIFFDLVKFLELRTLIITDLDTTKKNGEGKYIACKVSEGTRTSNACIKSWFGNPNTQMTPVDLINKSDAEKTLDFLRIAYQIPEAEDKPCGRTLEDAFILANSELFELTGDIEEDAWNTAGSKKKSEFALRHAIEQTNWNVPRYISEGLVWLADVPECPKDDIPPLRTIGQEVGTALSPEIAHA